MQKEIKSIAEGELGTRPSWDEFFMGMAIWYSSRGSCLYVKAGSVIVQNNEPIGTGYNGAPKQLKSCLVTGCRKEMRGLKYKESLNSATCVGVHAEMNALGHLKKTGLNDISIYTTIFPCHDCAKDLLPYGLSRIVFKGLYSEKEADSTYDLLKEAGVKIERLDLSPERYVDIEFNRPARSFDVWTPDERKRIERMLIKPN
jgi:dCMP deaminase